MAIICPSVSYKVPAGFNSHHNRFQYGGEGRPECLKQTYEGKSLGISIIGPLGRLDLRRNHEVHARHLVLCFFFALCVLLICVKLCSFPFLPVNYYFRIETASRIQSCTYFSVCIIS